MDLGQLGVSFSQLFVILLLQFFLSMCHMVKSPCHIERTYSPTYRKEGDLVIGGFFSFLLKLEPKTDSIYFRTPPRWTAAEPKSMMKHYQHLLALQFAVDEINKNPHLLPNITLGYQLLNNFHNNKLAVESSLVWLSGMGPTIPNYSCGGQPNSVAVIGGISATLSMSMATILTLYKVPQISYGPFDLLLNDKVQYPYVYQMGSRESTLHLAFIQVMLHFGWTWVGLVISDNVKGENFFRDLKEEMLRNGLCVAFKERVPRNFRTGQEVLFFFRINRSSSNVIFIYGDTDSLQELSATLKYYTLYHKMLVTTSSWDFSVDSAFKLYSNFHGTMLFSKAHMEIPGFTGFVRSLNPRVNPEDLFLKSFWESIFNCRLSEQSHVELLYSSCPEGISLTKFPFINFDMVITELSYNVYNAVYSVAHALHEMLQSEAKETSGLGRNPDLSWKLHHFLKCIHPFNSASDVSCGDGTGMAAETYDILNFKFSRNHIDTLVKVGKVMPHGQGLSINEEDIDWPDDFRQTPTSICSRSCGPGLKKTVRESQPICCFDCTPCPEGMFSNETDSEQCLQCPEHQYPSKKRDRCLDKTVTFLAYEEPLGMTLASAAFCFSLLTALVLGVFVKHRDTPLVKANNRSLSYTILVSLILCFLCSLLFIGRPNTTTCLLRQTIFAVVFTVAIGSILAKTVTVLLAFRTLNPGSQLRRWLSSTASYSLILICTLIQMCLCGIWLGTYPPFLEMDMHAEPAFIVIQCNEGSILIFYCVLGYMALLALGSFTMAFLARNLPDTFNEAKFLTFSMLVFCSVWIAFLPTYQSTKGKAMVAMEVFCILTSSAGILTCIFAPKCYVILLRSERNTLELLKKKAKPCSSSITVK
ncbi:vomeronasal type-2 receptor 26-like [Trichosurus vulpecula]|uniref:vomeronasal type-2 receptor 26-like n=1 Tax=Trichosurus vulpecula TaxID=9337 RepID=UPI00186B467F|nr:vomeronasal type-2 receptor 26-like [Trichosurus vulpecula]